MKASIVALATRAVPTLAREAAARQAVTEARAELRAVMARGGDVAAIATALEWYERMVERTAAAWARRARRAERAIRDALGFDLSDEQAARLLSALHGHAGERRRNPGGLSDHELQHIENYRRCDQRVRNAVPQNVRGE
jgi:hypothetical protein